MDSTSTTGDLASENIEKVPSAGPMKSTDFPIQATDVRSQSEQYGGSTEDLITRDLAKLGTIPDSPEAVDAGAQADTKKDGLSRAKDIKDDISIPNIDLRLMKSEQPYNFEEEHSDDLLASYKRDGAKYARVAALYTEGLQNRVSTLEKDLLELQYKLGSKERPDEERQVIGSSFSHRKPSCSCSNLLSHSDRDTKSNSPCADPSPLKVMQLSLKNWKDGLHHGKWSKASIFLATTTGTSSSLTSQLSDQSLSYDKDSHAANVRRSGPLGIARLAFSSPWPLILIELLSGEAIGLERTWIYPFKHIVVYEKQFRKFVELLNKISMDLVEPEDLSHILGKIVSEIVRTLGPERNDVEYSDTYVSSVLQKRDALKNHHWKVKASLPKDQEEELEDVTEVRPMIPKISPVDDPVAKVSEPPNLAPEGEPAPKEVHYACTCLKDARDQLQLLVDTIDCYLESLVTLRNAIHDREISKISFEHLWYLFQPGDVVVTSKQPHQAYRVIHVSGGRPLLTNIDIAREDKSPTERPISLRQSQVSPFNIDCVRFDFDGEKYGPVQDTISIFEYEEDRIITKLDVYPIGYAEKEEELSKALLDRGRRFAEYQGFQHKRYEGLSLSEPQEEVSIILELLV